jgi:hypothetical protein
MFHHIVLPPSSSFLPLVYFLLSLAESLLTTGLVKRPLVFLNTCVAFYGVCNLKELLPYIFEYYVCNNEIFHNVGIPYCGISFEKKSLHLSWIWRRDATPHHLTITSCCHASFLLGLFFDLEDGGDKLFWNIGWLSSDYTALYSRK